MENKRRNIWQIISIILIIIIIILIATMCIMNKGSKTNKRAIPQKIDNIEGVTNGTEIRIIERLLKDGHVEGLDNVRWTDATIRQEYNYMTVEIRLTNESEADKAEAKTIIAKLYDKDGNGIAMQETQMEEIPENYAFTTIYLNFDISDINLVYDIQLTAK